MNEDEQPGRHSIRVKRYDYAQAGGYFVTMVTMRRECLFGEIVNREMKFNTLGRIIQECWQAIPEHFPNTDVGVFVVMPNHVHGIILIHENVGRGTIYPAGRMPITGARRASPLPAQGTSPGSLGTIIGSFKSSVSRRAGRELNSGNIWQRNYYEHIIRDERDYERIIDYISTNPIHWEDDEENQDNLVSPAKEER
jgi:putative transposase